ncbi:MAG: NAD(P)-dependent alcohol dehydrogenase, partial [Bacteroidota bacterium]
KMKAVVCTGYGSPEVLQIQETNLPQPKDKEILLKIHATSATSGDARIRRADPYIVRLIFGFKRPKNAVLGVVVAGEVKAIGKSVSKFKVGDQVFGSAGMQFGAYAEYVTIPEEGTLALKPQQLTYEEAAAIPFGALAALHFLRKAKLQAGQKVLINGASGAVGTAAIQIAKSFDVEVTAVCSSRNFSLVKSLGADKVVDYTKEDFSKRYEKYDVVMEAVGKSTVSQGLNALRPKGTLLLVSASFGKMFYALFASMMSGKKIVMGVDEENAEGMGFLRQLLMKGQLKPVIDRIYPMEEVVDAHRYVDTGRKSGNVVLTII